MIIKTFIWVINLFSSLAYFFMSIICLFMACSIIDTLMKLVFIIISLNTLILANYYWDKFKIYKYGG